MWNLDTVLSSKPVLPLARSDCKDGVISLDNIHNDVSMNKSKVFCSDTFVSTNT